MRSDNLGYTSGSRLRGWKSDQYLRKDRVMNDLLVYTESLCRMN